MCGIFLSLSTTRHVFPSETTAGRLQSRGPDSTSSFTIAFPANATNDGTHSTEVVYVTLHSTVLSLRGSTTVQQPYQDVDGRYTLCWNGEAWGVAGELVSSNDTALIHRLLVNSLQAVVEGDAGDEAIAESGRRVANALSTVAGPYAFAFLDHTRRRLFFGRDFLGRRSLLTTINNHGDFVVSSVSHGDAQAGWKELETSGVYCVDLATARASHLISTLRPTPQAASGFYEASYLFSDISIASSANEASPSVIPRLSLNKQTSLDQTSLKPHSPAVGRLEGLLQSSLALRVVNIPDPPAAQNIATGGDEVTRLAILFSGGLDCTVLARMSHDLLPGSHPIDLLNVAFENPRIHKRETLAAATEFYETCPDRITGRASHAELQRVCPDRAWRFVAINVPYAEFLDHRELIISLMHPHNTEMDLSIASALYFAARGQGQIPGSSNGRTETYSTPARVLLSGLGADELFAGYTRHATAFKRNGLTGLLDELELDVSRLGKRNLGRDDRVMSHWGREIRYPYLDEELLAWALKAPVTEKCGFTESDVGVTRQPIGEDSSSILEPGKKVLRCLAWRLGMRDVAKEKKRAIQFGARTAKMQTGKSKGTNLLT